jgi:hypothetical protein
LKISLKTEEVKEVVYEDELSVFTGYRSECKEVIEFIEANYRIPEEGPDFAYVRHNSLIFNRIKNTSRISLRV